MKDFEKLEQKIDHMAKSGNMNNLELTLDTILESYVKERVKDER